MSWRRSHPENVDLTEATSFPTYEYDLPGKDAFASVTVLAPGEHVVSISLRVGPRADLETFTEQLLHFAVATRDAHR